MTFEDKILEAIKADYAAGITQVKLAAKYHTTQSYIQRILSGQKKIEGISLGTFSKMFPNATVDLGVDVQRNTRANVINNNFGSAEQTYNEAPRQDADAIRTRITDLAVSLADDNGTLPLAPFLKALRDVK